MQFDAAFFIDGGRPRILVVGLEVAGTTRSIFWDSSVWHFYDAITYIGGPAANFSAIAMNGDQRFYGIANGKIVEYVWEVTDLQRFVYVGDVALLRQ